MPCDMKDWCERTVLQVGGVDRLTDTSKYTGAHKQRFDESGKGRGIEGREDVSDKSGYVQGYKEKDTYDKKHQSKSWFSLPH